MLPAAWEYADYGANLRKYLPTAFHTIAVHRCNRPLFASVTEGSVVLIAKGHMSDSADFRRYEHQTPGALVAAIGMPDQTSTPRQISTPTPKNSRPRHVPRLAEIVDIRLGGVTGDAPYFLLTERQRLEYQLPVQCLRPVVTKANHLRGSELTLREWWILRESGARIWLFRPNAQCLSHADVAAYLKIGECRPAGHKVSNRTPWHLTPLPRTCDGFLSGMSNAGPWIALRVMPRLTANNTLYTVRFLKRCSLEERAAWALALLTSGVREQLQDKRRVYAAGLSKLEPSDLGQLLLPIPSARPGAREALRLATNTLLGDQAQKSSQLADRWFLSKG